VADIISLGIGAPGGITPFILVGLSPGAGGGGGAGVIASSDLTTQFVDYMQVLRDASGGGDTTTLIAKDLPNVDAGADLNTRYKKYFDT
jgi:hypothetical protein